MFPFCQVPQPLSGGWVTWWCAVFKCHLPARMCCSIWESQLGIPGCSICLSAGIFMDQTTICMWPNPHPPQSCRRGWESCSHPGLSFSHLQLNEGNLLMSFHRASSRVSVLRLHQVKVNDGDWHHLQLELRSSKDSQESRCLAVMALDYGLHQVRDRVGQGRVNWFRRQS